MTKYFILFFIQVYLGVGFFHGGVVFAGGKKIYAELKTGSLVMKQSKKSMFFIHEVFKEDLVQVSGILTSGKIRAQDGEEYKISELSPPVQMIDEVSVGNQFRLKIWWPEGCVYAPLLLSPVGVPCVPKEYVELALDGKILSLFENKMAMVQVRAGYSFFGIRVPEGEQMQLPVFQRFFPLISKIFGPDFVDYKVAKDEFERYSPAEYWGDNQSHDLWIHADLLKGAIKTFEQFKSARFPEESVPSAPPLGE